MPNLRGKVFPSYTTKSESSTKGYMKPTAEWRNKQKNRNVDEEDQEKKRSPLKSPRLCEEKYSPYNLHDLQRGLEINRDYYPQKYDDPAQAQPIENNTYFQTLPQDEFGEPYEHKPRPFSGKKPRKQRLAAPQSSEKYEEYREKAEFGEEHKRCMMKLSAKEKEINKLKGIIDKISKPLEAKRLTYGKEQSKKIDDLQRQVKMYKDDLLSAKSNLKEEQEKIKQLIHQNQGKEDELSEMRFKYMRLRKGINEYKQIHEVSAEREKKIVEQQTELEKMCNKMVKFKKANDALSERNDVMEDSIRKLQTKLDHYSTTKAENAKVKYLQTDLDAKTEEVNKLTLQLIRAESLSLELKILQREKENVEQQNSEFTRALQAKGIEIESLNKHLERSEEQIRNLNNEISDIQKSKRHTVNENLQQLLTENSSLRSTLEHRNLKIENLSKECEKQRRTREKGIHEMTDLEQVVQKKKNEVDVLNTGLEDLSKKCSALHRDKEEAHAKIGALTDALHDKESENESLTNQLERSETQVAVLNSRIDDMQRMSTDAADNSKSIFQYENASLKSAYDQATFKYKDLSKELTNVKRDKENAENQISSLSHAFYHKEKELESVKYKLARIEDILNKGTSLQKYKTEAEHKTNTLMNALKEKETENGALKEQLARAEKNVSILSQDIKDTQASKRQAAEEKLQYLQTENASLKSDLSKATNEIKDLLNKGINLQKYKTEAEHKTSTLMNALQDKETENEALREQLARSEKFVSILSEDIKNIQESKRQVADEKLQDLQTKNASLKLSLAEATTEIDDLWNKCTKLQKYESETEHKIRTLLDAVEEKDAEIENLNKHLARSEKNVSILSKDIKDIQGSKHQAADEKVQDLEAENASLQLELAKATTEIDVLRNKCTSLQKYKTDTDRTIKTLLNAEKELNEQLARKNNELSKDVSNLKKDRENSENQRNSISKALDEKEKDMELMRNEIARYKEKISILTKYVEDIQGSKNQAADENMTVFQKKINSLESDLRSANTEMNDLSHKYKHLQKDKENAEYTINKLSKTVQERNKEIDSLVEELAMANENGNKAEQIASDGIIQKLKEDNAFLKSDLDKQKQETDKKVSDLTKETQILKKSKGTSSDEYNTRKLYEENEFLKAQLDRTSRRYMQTLSSVAGDKPRNNNPGIAYLSDENRPINLGKKFSQLYDDQWTDAIEHLEEMGFSETDGIRCLLDILKAVFDECVKASDNHFKELKELTGTSHLPSDQLKKLKDLRKATAIQSVAKTKQLVNNYLSKAFSKEKAACQSYIDRSLELCWLMCVQDPPIVIDFIAVHGQAIDDKILRKYTKTGSKVDFLVWPVIRLHKNGPLLEKGVVQPI